MLLSSLFFFFAIPPRKDMTTQGWKSLKYPLEITLWCRRLFRHDTTVQIMALKLKKKKTIKVSEFSSTLASEAFSSRKHQTHFRISSSVSYLLPFLSVSKLQPRLNAAVSSHLPKWFNFSSKIFFFEACFRVVAMVTYYVKKRNGV